MGIVTMGVIVIGLWRFISGKAALIMCGFLLLTLVVFHTSPDPRRCFGTARHWSCL